MKVVHVTHNDGNGGASIAAYRLHQGLLARGVDSAFCEGSLRKTRGCCSVLLVIQVRFP